MIRAVILLVLAACASSKSAEQHAEVVAAARVVEQDAAQSTETGHRVTGPELELQFGVASPDALSLATGPSSTSKLGIGLHAGGASTRVDASDSLPSHGPLVKAIYRGAAAEDWMRTASGTHGAEQQTTLHVASEAHSASKWRVGLPWLSLAALAVGLALAWKSGWLGKGLALLGRIF